MKRVWIAIVVVLVALAGVIGWQVVKPSEPEPVYKGRTLTSWLEDYYVTNTNPFESYPFNFSSVKLNSEALYAVIHIGTNAIPVLLRLLRVKDSPLKAKIAGLLQHQHLIKVDYKPAQFWNDLGVNGFSALCVASESDVQVLIQIAKEDPSSYSAYAAYRSLQRVRPRAAVELEHLLLSTNRYMP